MTKLKLNEISVSHLKGSGPGGQNRNKRMTGVRVTHLPTGITVLATERRSQKQNLEAALSRLEEKLERLFHRPTPRKKTAPPARSTRERLTEKRAQSFKKKLRSSKKDEWD
ncbi:MAG: peptide chain release factor-like protein [Pseudomonadota bacterium]